jgi:hypothetical protein
MTFSSLFLECFFNFCFVNEIALNMELSHEIKTTLPQRTATRHDDDDKEDKTFRDLVKSAGQLGVQLVDEFIENKQLIYKTEIKKTLQEQRRKGHVCKKCNKSFLSGLKLSSEESDSNERVEKGNVCASNTHICRIAPLTRDNVEGHTKQAATRMPLETIQHGKSFDVPTAPPHEITEYSGLSYIEQFKQAYRQGEIDLATDLHALGAKDAEIKRLQEHLLHCDARIKELSALYEAVHAEKTQVDSSYKTLQDERAETASLLGATQAKVDNLSSLYEAHQRMHNEKADEWSQEKRYFEGRIQLYGETFTEMRNLNSPAAQKRVKGDVEELKKRAYMEEFVNIVDRKQKAKYKTC